MIEMELSFSRTAQKSAESFHCTGQHSLLVDFPLYAGEERMKSYKQQHEEFVSNHNGSSLLTLIICLCHIPLLILILKLIYNRQDVGSCSTVTCFLCDLLFLIIPTVFVITVVAPYQHITLLLLLIAALILLYVFKPTGNVEAMTSFCDSTAYLTVFKGKVAIFLFSYILFYFVLCSLSLLVIVSFHS
jgi:hypothetical protein